MIHWHGFPFAEVHVFLRNRKNVVRPMNCRKRVDSNPRKSSICRLKRSREVFPSDLRSFSVQVPEHLAHSIYSSFSSSGLRLNSWGLFFALGRATSVLNCVPLKQNTFTEHGERDDWRLCLAWNSRMFSATTIPTAEKRKNRCHNCLRMVWTPFLRGPFYHSRSSTGLRHVASVISGGIT